MHAVAAEYCYETYVASQGESECVQTMFYSYHNKLFIPIYMCWIVDFAFIMRLYYVPYNGQFLVTVFSRFCYVLLCNCEYIHCLNHRQAKDYITRRNETERKLLFERRLCSAQGLNCVLLWILISKPVQQTVKCPKI